MLVGDDDSSSNATWNGKLQVVKFQSDQERYRKWVFASVRNWLQNKPNHSLKLGQRL